MTLTSIVRGDIDIITGAQAITGSSITIKRAILMPESEQRKFVYDLAYLAGAGVAFTQGGDFDQGLTTLLLDQKDLGTFVPVIGMKAEFNGQIAYVKTVQKLNNGQGYNIGVTDTKGVS